MKAYKLVEVEYVKYDGSNYDEIKEAIGHHLATEKNEFEKDMPLDIRGMLLNYPLKKGEYLVWNETGWIHLMEEEFRKSYRTEI